jgi:hypothetical protein
MEGENGYIGGDFPFPQFFESARFGKLGEKTNNQAGTAWLFVRVCDLKPDCALFYG